MVRRYEVMDEQWKIIEPHLENKAKRTERPQVDSERIADSTGFHSGDHLAYPSRIDLQSGDMCIPSPSLLLRSAAILVHVCIVWT